MYITNPKIEFIGDAKLQIKFFQNKFSFRANNFIKMYERTHNTLQRAVTYIFR